MAQTMRFWIYDDSLYRLCGYGFKNPSVAQKGMGIEETRKVTN